MLMCRNSLNQRQIQLIGNDGLLKNHGIFNENLYLPLRILQLIAVQAFTKQTVGNGNTRADGHAFHITPVFHAVFHFIKQGGDVTGVFEKALSITCQI